MAVPDGQNYRIIDSHVANAESQSSPGRDVDDGGVKCSKDPTPARQDAAADSPPVGGDDAATRSQDVNETHASPAPPVFQLPGPERIHNGWDASNVSTAKCDMCHRQRCGTIQKCSECKLSVCKQCAYADRLQDDGRHVLIPEAVDWDTVPLSKGRKTKVSRGGRGRGSRGGRGAGRARGQGRGRGRGRRGAWSRAASSGATSTSFSPTVSPRTDTGSHNINDKWEEDCHWADEEHMSASETTGFYKRPMKRARGAISPTASPPTEAQDVAQILAGMPGGLPNGERGSMKRRKYSHQQSPQNNVLPPVRSVPDPRQSGYLPSLRTLHPPLASDILPLQPPILNRGLQPPRATPVAYMGHVSAPQDGPVYRNANQVQANASFEAQHQASRVYQYSPTAPHYYNSGGPAVSYNTPSLSPAAQHSVRESQTVSRTQYNDTPFVGNLYGQYPSHGYDERTPGYGSPSVYYFVEPQHAVSSRGGVYGSPAELKVQRDVVPAGTVKEQGTKLKEDACDIKRSEHRDWPLEHCLRLAAKRSWSRILAKGLGVDRREAFEHFCASTNFAILDIGLKERNNAARSWLCEQDRRLAEDGAVPTLKMSMSSFLPSVAKNDEN
ncbi:hypothetical protein TOPH_04902 [Tolypocladium ophioglossoides CBS 100239]|uniref:Uncharacterized protein n=1 Tax=Tolypocladium ophioglossoides (strain CBS 100239) TaxID=1163406 RepID=A0A0L0N8H9_TOLOC|nr:hypothetical protein TOPH_04902 [Tolypocladium ophioglossoides CBS 100239]